LETRRLLPPLRRGPLRRLEVVAFPAYQLLVVQERLREQEAEGVEMPEGMERDELALQILIAAALMAERSRTR
jgi:hypothetical protein